MVTVPDDVRERVLSYVKHQATKEPDEISEAVQKGHDQLLGLIDGLSEEQAAFKPSADEWCVLEVLQHVVSGKRGTARLCAALGEGRKLEGSAQLGRGADSETLPSLADARSALDATHQELLGFLSALSPDTDVEGTYDHPFFGPLNCRQWAAFQRVHDGDHAGQIEQVRAASGFPST